MFYWPNNNGRFRVKTGSISGYRFHSSKYIERNTRKRFPSLLCKSNGNSVKRPDRQLWVETLMSTSSSSLY